MGRSTTLLTYCQSINQRTNLDLAGFDSTHIGQVRQNLRLF